MNTDEENALAAVTSEETRSSHMERASVRFGGPSQVVEVNRTTTSGPSDGVIGNPGLVIPPGRVTRAEWERLKRAGDAAWNAFEMRFLRKEPRP